MKTINQATAIFAWYLTKTTVLCLIFYIIPGQGSSLSVIVLSVCQYLLIMPNNVWDNTAESVLSTL